MSGKNLKLQTNTTDPLYALYTLVWVHVCLLPIYKGFPTINWRYSWFLEVNFAKILQNSGSLLRASKSNEGHFRFLRMSKKSEKIKLSTITENCSFLHVTLSKLCLSSIYKWFPTINWASGNFLWEPVWSILQKFYKIQGAFSELQNQTQATLDSYEFSKNQKKSDIQP